jgi:hypothetical protein
VKRALTGCLLAGALSVQLGPTTTERAVEQMNRSSMRGVPVPRAPSAPRPDMVWVPDRYVRVPGQPDAVHVPGHWVQVTPEGNVIVPPLTGTASGTGRVETVPRPAPGQVEVDPRQSP